MLLTIKDLARQLQIKPSTLYAWAAQGKIPCLKIHRLLRFRPEEVTRWVESFNKNKPKSVPISFRNADQGEINTLVARACREVYRTPHGETRLQSSLTRKEGSDGAL